ncbi:hypothetical protein [Ensifer sp. SL37]|uniref:hypothetical protein n=1 Tax=Ensifer sp. SL37 TaxID=2995137 RepID=UPI0022723412|nr:hypothetical protein [Ensifer sp. SL37]MCY1744989.1 hypothetical protein [Ensifer sp. SL37]
MTVGSEAGCSIDAMATGGGLAARTQKAGLGCGKGVLNGIEVFAGRRLEVVFQYASEARVALDADGHMPVTLEQLRDGFTVKLTGFASDWR